MDAQITVPQSRRDNALQRLVRTFRVSAWLGWQIEANWADPLVFAIYALIKPLASAAIIVVMYGIITQGDFGQPIFAYIFIGNAFYIYVGQVMSGVSWAVIDDREHYRMLKYVYIAPIHIPTYLLGRGVAKFVFASISVFVTLLAGALFLQVPLDLLQVDWLLFIVSLAIGVNMLALMGLMLGSIVLLLVNHSFGMGEAVAGALYLFSGAIFPLEVLPAWIRWLGYVMPVTYWLELIRRALLPDIAAGFPTLANLSNAQL